MLKLVRKISVAIAGGAVLLAGLISIVLPTPAVVAIKALYKLSRD